MSRSEEKGTVTSMCKLQASFGLQGSSDFPSQASVTEVLKQTRRQITSRAGLLNSLGCRHAQEPHERGNSEMSLMLMLYLI